MWRIFSRARRASRRVRRWRRWLRLNNCAFVGMSRVFLFLLLAWTVGPHRFRVVWSYFAKQRNHHNSTTRSHCTQTHTHTHTLILSLHSHTHSHSHSHSHLLIDLELHLCRPAPVPNVHNVHCLLNATFECNMPQPLSAKVHCKALQLAHGTAAVPHFPGIDHSTAGEDTVHPPDAANLLGEAHEHCDLCYHCLECDILVSERFR